MDECTDFPIQRLVGCDPFFHLVQARLEDPDKKDKKGFTLLHKSALSREDHSKALKLLLQRGADVNSTSPQGHTPLHFAVSSRKRDTVIALIQAKASVNAKDLWGRTALHFAITKRWPDPSSPAVNLPCDMWIVKKLMNHPYINLNPVDHKGETPLMWAVKERNPAAVEELLKKGADPNISNQKLWTPLHEALAAQYPSNDIISLLLTHSADIYYKDNLGDTPLHILVFENTQDDQTVFDAVRWIRLIVLRYRITKKFQCLMKEHFALGDKFEKFWEEIQLMKGMFVYDKFTLHDFALGRIQIRVKDPVAMVCVPVVEMLLIGCYVAYFEFILHRIPIQDFRSMLGIISDHPIPTNASHLTLFEETVKCYDKNAELMRRLNKAKDILINSLLSQKKI